MERIVIIFAFVVFLDCLKKLYFTMIFEDFFPPVKFGDYLEETSEILKNSKEKEKYLPLVKSYNIARSLASSIRSSMVTFKTMDFLNFITAHISNQIPGCLVEIGSWRGGYFSFDKNFFKVEIQRRVSKKKLSFRFVF